MKRLSNINESHWSEMNRRSQGIKVRKEDDVDFLNGKDFADYLSKRYSFENEYKIEYDKTLNTLTIPVCTGYYDLSVDYTNDSSKILYICISKSILPEQVCSALKKKFKMRYGDSYIFLSPSDGREPTNQFVVDVLDYMVDLNMDDINIRKSIKESHWSEMNRRSQGIMKRKEDDIDLLDMGEFFNYIKKNYGNKLDYLDKFTETISINTKGNLWIYLHYENRELSKIQFVLTGASSTKKYKKDFEQLKNSFPEGLTIKNESGYYYIEEVSNRSAIKLIDYFLGFELYESHWSEMNRRSQGIQKRKEDDIEQLDRDDLYDLIINKYELKPNYKAAQIMKSQTSPENKYISLPVFAATGTVYRMSITFKDKVIKSISIQLHNTVCRQWCPSLYDKFLIAENGTGNGIYIYSKNETVTNSLCMDVIETIVNDSERSALQKREN